MKDEKKKMIRTSTVAMSLDFLLMGQLRFLNQYYDVIAVSGRDSSLDKVEIREGVQTLSVSMERKISLFKDLKSLLKLYLLFRREKPCIVHSITPKAGLLSMTAAYFARVPVRIHTFTGLIFPYRKGLFQRILIFMDCALCFFATEVYPEGEGVKNDLIKYKITRKPLKVIHKGNLNGIDVSHFNPDLFPASQNDSLRKKLNIPHSNFVFVYVGRLVSDKGINELMQAFDELYNELGNVNLLLVGCFENDMDPLTDEANYVIKNHEGVRFVGFQPDVRPYMAISNALVFPSYREGFPNVVLQAGAMKLPSIVTNISGCNEIIKENINGSIIPVKNYLAIKDAMRNFVQNPSKVKELGCNSRIEVESNFEQIKVWNALLKEYNSVLSKKKDKFK